MALACVGSPDRSLLLVPAASHYPDLPPWPPNRSMIRTIHISINSVYIVDIGMCIYAGIVRALLRSGRSVKHVLKSLDILWPASLQQPSCGHLDRNHQDRHCVPSENSGLHFQSSLAHGRRFPYMYAESDPATHNAPYLRLISGSGLGIRKRFRMSRGGTAISNNSHSCSERGRIYWPWFPISIYLYICICI